MSATRPSTSARAAAAELAHELEELARLELERVRLELTEHECYGHELDADEHERRYLADQAAAWIAASLRGDPAALIHTDD